MEQQPSTRKSRRCRQSGEGLAIGLGIGLALGAAFNNLAIGIALGVGVGVIFDEIIARRSRPWQ
ncbi:MAG TPA: hypothetical protein VN729_12170 [Ktedonobacteraceae bacterium]|nr:hypothetical protein [Ktedonobacteraceae bacterium]